MSFVSPYYLFTAIGIVVPIAIHLWNRKSGKVIKVGSVKFLKESESSSFSNVRLSEWVLLILRILLILLLSMIMAGTSYVNYNKQHTKTHLIDHALINNSKYSRLIDSLQHELHLLQPGFPEIGAKATDYVDYWQLIANMEEKQDQEFVVFSSNLLKNFKGKKRMLPQNVDWIYLPIEAHEFIIGAQLTKEDTLIIFTGISDESYLKIEQSQLKYAELASQFTVDNKEILFDKIGQYLVFNEDTVAIQTKPIITCQVIYDQKYKEDVTYLASVLNAIIDYGVCDINVEYVESISQTDTTVDWHIWMTESQVESKGRNIIYNKDVLGSRIIKSEYRDTYFLADRIHPQFTDVDELAKLPGEILNLFLGNLFIAQIDKHDSRKIDNRQLANQLVTEKVAQIPVNSDLTVIIWVLFLITLLAERLLSLIRKQ